MSDDWVKGKGDLSKISQDEFEQVKKIAAEIIEKDPDAPSLFKISKTKYGLSHSFIVKTNDDGDIVVGAMSNKKFSEEGILGKGGLGVVAPVLWEDGKTEAVKITAATNYAPKDSLAIRAGLVHDSFARSYEQRLADHDGKKAPSLSWIKGREVKSKHYSLMPIFSHSLKDELKSILSEFNSSSELQSYRATELQEKLLKLIKLTTSELVRVHRSKIAHLDLKPENFMLNGEVEAKLVDFDGSVECNDVEIKDVDAKHIDCTFKYAPPEIDFFEDDFGSDFSDSENSSNSSDSSLGHSSSSYSEGTTRTLRVSHKWDVYSMGKIFNEDPPDGFGIGQRDDKSDFHEIWEGLPDQVASSLSSMCRSMMKEELEDRPSSEEVAEAVATLNINKQHKQKK